MDVIAEGSTVSFLCQKRQDLLPRPGAFLRPGVSPLWRSLGLADFLAVSEEILRAYDTVSNVLDDL